MVHQIVEEVMLLILYSWKNQLSLTDLAKNEAAADDPVMGAGMAFVGAERMPMAAAVLVPVTGPIPDEVVAAGIGWRSGGNRRLWGMVVRPPMGIPDRLLLLLPAPPKLPWRKKRKIWKGLTVILLYKCTSWFQILMLNLFPCLL